MRYWISFHLSLKHSHQCWLTVIIPGLETKKSKPEHHATVLRPSLPWKPSLHTWEGLVFSISCAWNPAVWLTGMKVGKFEQCHLLPTQDIFLYCKTHICEKLTFSQMWNSHFFLVVIEERQLQKVIGSVSRGVISTYTTAGESFQPESLALCKWFAAGKIIVCHGLKGFQAK